MKIAEFVDAVGVWYENSGTICPEHSIPARGATSPHSIVGSEKQYGGHGYVAQCCELFALFSVLPKAPSWCVIIAHL